MGKHGISDKEAESSVFIPRTGPGGRGRERNAREVTTKGRSPVQQIYFPIKPFYQKMKSLH